MIIFGHFRGSLDPLQIYNPYEFALTSCVYPRLVRLNREGNVIGDLAQSWKISPDGRTIVFRIKPDYKPRKVAAHFQKVLTGDGPGFHRDLLKKIVGARENWIVAGPKDELTIKLLKPYSSFLYLLSSVEFAIPTDSKPNSNDIVGFYGLDLTTLVPGKKFKIEKGANVLLEISVESDLNRIQAAVDSKSVDILLGLPEHESKFANLVDYDRQFLSTLNSQIIHLNRNEKVFKSSELRRHLYNIFQSFADQWANENSEFSTQKSILPKGTMPPEYYTNPGGQDRLAIKSLANLIKDEPLDIWFSSDYFPKSFRDHLDRHFNIHGKEILRIHFKPFAEAKSDLSKGVFEMIFVDPGAFFPDPDSYLEIWSKSFPKELFPFPGNQLLKDVDRIKFQSDKLKRLRGYSKIIKKFENEHWVIPMFAIREPIVKLTKLKIEAPEYRYMDSICELLNIK